MQGTRRASDSKIVTDFAYQRHADRFYNDGNGNFYHSYSIYARGLDMLIGAYNLIDLVHKGRDEAELPWKMAWIRHHDKYNG